MDTMARIELGRCNFRWLNRQGFCLIERLSIISVVGSANMVVSSRQRRLLMGSKTAKECDRCVLLCRLPFKVSSVGFFKFAMPRRSSKASGECRKIAEQ